MPSFQVYDADQGEFVRPSTVRVYDGGAFTHRVVRAHDGSQFVVVFNQAPSASFTATTTDLTVDVDASGSSDLDGTIQSYEWDWGDGATGSGQTASHTYASGGDYTITLTVTDDMGAMSSTTVTVTVTEAGAVEQWGMYEQSFTGPDAANPYQDVSLSATFTHTNTGTQKTPDGFWDGSNIHKIRFMPTLQGEWTFETTSNTAELDGITGSFTADAPSTGNHGHVVVDGTHFAYADGTRYYPFGTTCYGLSQVEPAKIDMTLSALDNYGAFDGVLPFNKVRMSATEHQPTSNLDPGNDDLRDDSLETVYMDNSAKDQINPAWFQLVDSAVEKLLARGVEIQLILQHSNAEPDPDSYSTSQMDKIIRYMVSRYGAYRNIQWCLANEWGNTNIGSSRWSEIGRNVRSHEHVRHTCTIHPRPGDTRKARTFATEDWYSYICLQARIDQDDGISDLRGALDDWGKPYVNDEYEYEGDQGFNFELDTVEDGARGFYRAMLAGGYATHGETYDQQFFRGGGDMHAVSTERVAFMLDIFHDSPPFQGLEPIGGNPRGVHKGEEFYLFYYGKNTPTEKTYDLPSGNTYTVDVIDTWKMTVDNRGEFSDSFTINLPGEPYISVRMEMI